MGCFSIPKVLRIGWRNPSVFNYLAIIEFPLTVACLALFGTADPNSYRTKLWREGYKNHWNSDPVDVIYAIANYKPVDTPRPWQQNTTDYNVAISVMCMFFLLAKVTLYILGGLPPALSAFVHAGLLATYALSAYFQAGPDYLSKEFPSKTPWYLSRGCGPPADQSLWSQCQQARAAFGVAVAMCTLYATFLCWSIYQAIPTQAQREGIRLADEDERAPSTMYTDDEKWEYDLDRKADLKDSPAIPMTPMSPALPVPPMTPRTQAYHTLSGGNNTTHSRNRDLPLRHHIAMGDDVYQGTKGKGVAL